MKRLFLLALLGAVLLRTTPVLAEDGFYVIGGGGKPVCKEITSLPAATTKSGMYYLSRNLTHVYTPGIPALDQIREKAHDHAKSELSLFCPEL